MNYSQYYLSEPLGSKGIKPVYGATGLGKTFGIKEYIKSVLTHKPEQKFIYITNRHALIQELHQDLEVKYKISTCYLKSSVETFQDMAEQKGNAFMECLEHLISNNFFRYDKRLKEQEVARQYFKDQLENLKKNQLGLNQVSGSHKQLIQEDTKKVLDTLLKTVKKQFYELKKNARELHQQFLTNKAIWQLFPYIRFQHDPKATVLLGTVQKFCNGFFDGKQNLKLHELCHRDRGENYVIFLDEFDFLETEILNILAKEPQLQNSIEFVRFFMEEFDSWRNSSFWNKDPMSLKVKGDLQQIFDGLQTQIQKHKIKFPTIRKFKFIDGSFKQGKQQRFTLFQNNNTTLASRFYLEQSNTENNVFNIVPHETKHTINAFAFFSMIKNATDQLLATFYAIRERPNIMENLIHEIWNTKNDNAKGEYHRYISENFAYRPLQHAKFNQDFSYHAGFSVIKIKKTDHIDPELAVVQQLELITSPEAIIAALARNHLVFALSATADIERMVKSFSMKWLKTQNIPFIKPTEKDIELIVTLQKEKDDIRQSQVRFAPNHPIEKEHLLFKFCSKLQKMGFYENDGEDPSDITQDNRMHRSLCFFGCLDWILNKSANRTHLVFSNSFKREHVFFDDGSYKQEKWALRFKTDYRNKLTAAGFKITQQGLGGLGYRLEFQDKVAHLIFLNADTNRRLGDFLLKNGGFNPAYDMLFLDETADKVVMISQYETASNGLNLRCLNTQGAEIDFESIHLLEPKYFWIDTNQETIEQSLQTEKKAYWYLWKLMNDGQLNNQKFRQLLSKMDAKDLNQYYGSEIKEVIFSQMALFYQALGRVDRKRIKVPPIEVTLGEGVRKIFMEFLDKYPTIVEERAPFTATFLLQLHDAMLQFYKKENKRALRASQQVIVSEQTTSQQTIRSLLQEIEQMRQKKYSIAEAKQIIHAWQELRHCVLHHDTTAVITYNKQTLDFKDLTFEVSLPPVNNQFFCETPFAPSYTIYNESFDKTSIWDLNYPYAFLVKNDFLVERFEQEGYPVHVKQRTTFFTPYIEQAILRAAIGETAIKFLLQKEQLFCEPEDAPPYEIFELFDAKLQQHPVYLDFKNFSRATQNLFILEKNDPFYQEDFDSEGFLKKIKQKLLRIRKITCQPNARYIVINFVSKQKNKTNFFDIDLNSVQYIQDSAITIVPSCITVEEPNQISTEFEKLTQFLNDLQPNL